ncbi:MAG TPA: DUF481 domain-containing protein [Elusimicrobiales bacterium]|nr:DUF481 domain-containing protein [Elusimicrobiales bacterium]
MRRGQLAAACLLTLFGAVPARAQSRTQDLRPKPPEYWASGKYTLDATLSGAYLKGNVDNTSVAGGLNYMARPAEKHQFSIESNASYASFNDRILLDNLKASGLYAYTLKPHLNLFAASTHAKNRSIKLDYRTTNGIGLCVHGFLPETFSPLLLSLALTPEQESYSDGKSESATRAMLRLNFKAPLNDYAALGADFAYTPDLAEFSDYRFYGETYFQFKITPETLFFRVTFSDEYDAMPRPGVKKNDFAVNYSVGLHLGK